MPKQTLNNPNENKYSREDIDNLGTLRILYDPSKWRKVNESEVDAEAKQKAIDVACELDFVTKVDDLSVPAYADSKKNIYNRKGDLLKIVNFDFDAWSACGDLVPVRCPHAPSACQMATEVRLLKHQKDSTGGVITCILRNVPAGYGEPCFDKLQAMLAHAMLSLPAVKGFEIGSGFDGTRMKGSQHNDPFCAGKDNLLGVVKNDAGGVLGGISSGADIYFRVAVKAVSTIGQAQQTVDYDGNATVLEAKGRHDPCVLPRCVPLVEAMSALVLADAAMLQLAREGSI